MKLRKYLKYNNIQLIDPTNEFHAKLIAFYTSRKYLTPAQVQALRSYCFSVEDIIRLTKESKPPKKRATATVKPKKVKKPSKPDPIEEDVIPF